VPEHLKEKVHEWVKRKLRFVDYAPLQFASVLKGEGVDEIIRTATDVWQNGGRQVSNALLRAEVLPRLEKSQPRYDARVLGLSQITARPPVFRLKMSNPDRATPTWQRRVISEIRHKYGFAGYPIILRIVR
jgi:predicted GTPase